MGQYIKQLIAERCPVPPMLRRIGFFGFMFFFLKGMLWLTVPAVLLLLGN
jgi:hypothetical protein